MPTKFSTELRKSTLLYLNPSVELRYPKNIEDIPGYDHDRKAQDILKIS